MIYIDPPLWPAHGTHFSHLVSDTSLEELHDFAAAAGIPLRAFDHDHYDVPLRRYEDLVASGAKPVDGGTLVRALITGGLRIPARERAASLVHPLRRRWDALVPGAEELLPAAGLPDSETAEVSRLVRLTAGHNPADGDEYGRLLCDADLAVLGRDPAAYDRYAADVRQEYRHVEDNAFRAGRRAVLETLLNRGNGLYRTARGEELWGTAARANLARELASLADCPAEAGPENGVRPARG